MDTEILLKIVAYRQEPRPVAWIARETGLDTKDVRAVLRVAGDSVPKSEIALDKYDQVEYLVSQGCSINEIVNTLGGSPAAVKKWFPAAGVKRGSEAHKESVRRGLMIREIERRETLIRDLERCPRGHAFTKENTKFQKTPSGGLGRVCVSCRRESQRRYRIRVKEGKK